MSTSVLPVENPASPSIAHQQYGITAYATVSCPLDSIAGLRSQLNDLDGKPFAPSFLKPSNEQTIVAIAAIKKAMEQHPLPKVDYTDWGVIAAARYIGRLNAAVATHQFRTGGAWKASPLFVPHHFLHSISGTISQAFSIHGPNFGVGGGPKATEEGLLTCLTFLDQYRPPGLWAVFSECNPEPRPDPEGKNDMPVVVHAAALAFVPVEEDWRGLRLTIRDSVSDDSTATTKENESLFARLTALIAQAEKTSTNGRLSYPLSWGCELRLSSN